MIASPVRLGVVGCGAVTRKCHLPALASVPELCLTALVDSDPGRAGEAALAAAECAPGGPPSVTSSLDDVLGDIDAALVCTSNATHAGVAARLLRAGKHVLAEKPLATTVDDGRMLAALAGETGLVLAVGHVRRLFPIAVWVPALLASGALGRAERVRWQEGEPFAWPAASAAPFQREAAGGGVAFDIGIHVLDLLLTWLGRDVAVAGYTDDCDGGVESEAHIALMFGDVAAEVVLSRQRSLGGWCEITGSRAVLRTEIGIPASYEIRSRSGQAIAGGTVPVTAPAEGTWRGLYVGQLRSFAAAIRSGVPPLADAAAGTRAVALVRACYAAGGQGPAHGGRRRAGDTWRRFRGPAEAAPGGSVAVTGAAGFLGSRLVEALVTGTRAQVLALAHSYRSLARLSRLDQARLRFGVADLGVAGLGAADGLETRLAGVDTVIHCAYGGTGSDEERWRATVDGTLAVAEACLAAGVGRLVHVSSVSVYDTAGATAVTEASPLLTALAGDLEYGQQKLAAERIMAGVAGRGLAVVVIQPTVIYGPHGPRWTVSALERLAREPGLLPSGAGHGICNAVYVDDVVSALLLAAAVPGAAGGRFIVSGPAPVSWGDFYDRYRDMLTVSRSSHAMPELPEWERAMYAQRARFSIDRAATVLGYQPMFGLDDGMARVRDWARWFGLLPAA